MPGISRRIESAGAFLAWLLALGLPLHALAQTPGISQPAAANQNLPIITNIAQLSRTLSRDERQYCQLSLEGVVCAASRPEMGVVILQDETGVELLELGSQPGRVSPGERIRLEGTRLLLRRRDMGAQVSPAPLIDNDGLHPWKMLVGEIALKKGRVPLELDWFNCLRNFALEVSFQPPGEQPQRIPDSALWHLESTESTGRSEGPAPGLKVAAYEGFWEKVPDFDLLKPVRTGTISNFDVGIRTRDELAGLRFKGLFEAPRDGTYRFQVAADDGALLFLGNLEVPLRRLGMEKIPAAAAAWIGQPMQESDERRWVAVQGRVSFVSRVGQGLELELRTSGDRLSVTVADALGLDPSSLLNANVRAMGVGRPALSAGRLILQRVLVASAQDLKRMDFEAADAEGGLASHPIAQVQAMSVEAAKRELPVRVRGIVTAANRSDRWFALQDDTRGIFVDHHSLTNAFPAAGELWEVAGHTAAGNFAPIIVATTFKHLGQGRMPEPARPSWNQLANGSMDVQWVEFQAAASAVQSNRLTLLLPEGSLQAQMENYFEPELKRYQQAVVRIRGTLFAVWNADTREVEFGSLLMRNASISVDAPPAADPFAGTYKSVRELRLFDLQSPALRPVKVRAQVVYAMAQELFTMQDGLGLRVLPAQPAALAPGDLIDAVGYPEISGPSPLLRQAVIRKTGSSMLPAPGTPSGADLGSKGLDSTRVSIRGKLIGQHLEQNSPVLEMQASGKLFVARVNPAAGARLDLRPGSQLQLTGVYSQSGNIRRLSSAVDAFELLLNSGADIRVLSQPSWWTLPRLGVVVGLLVVVLVLAAAWITQLRRQVEQRTRQLQEEIRARETAQRQRAIEAERSRIARDLHDDLGASLTVIGVLASSGQRRKTDADSSNLFRSIATKARSLIAALDVIVWAVDPEDNSLESLADYLSGFVQDFLAPSGLACRFKVPVKFPAVMLDGQVRHELLMSVKESLNNIVRHAAATEVEFRLAIAEGHLEITISDNGKGFTPGDNGEGHGLKNLPARLTRLGGRCEIESTPGQGTRVTIRLPLAEVPSSTGREEPHVSI
jgi:signal transduction histidine kinase